MRRWIIILLCVCSGCSLLRSRYAMDDPEYAEKYAVGAEKSDVLGKAKQALDARHTAGLAGMYVSGGTQVATDADATMGGAELGGEAYTTSWTTARGALSLFGGTDLNFLGFDGGLRLQTPTRVAPFVGIGTFQGYASAREPAEDDFIDNDDDGSVDERGEKRLRLEGWLSTVYPEVGAHFWINSHWRLTAYGRYLITTEGRRHDDWLLGGQLSYFHRYGPSQ